jgi:hypothetical protein
VRTPDVCDDDDDDGGCLCGDDDHHSSNGNDFHHLTFFFADGERVFFVSNPAIGLWSTRARFNSDPTSHAQTMALVESHTAADDGI